MGNNSSRSEIITKSLSHAEHQWRNSTPRQLPHLQHKVLPEKNVDTRLRLTNNGEILHNGGTLSKKANIVLASGKKDFEICRSNSISSHSSEKYNKVEKHRSFLSYHDDLGPKKVSQVQVRQNSEKISKQNSHVCSAMDIRDKYKNRKKYRAPSPPINVISDTKKIDENMPELAEKPGIRKCRLFKTQAELKTKKSSPLSIEETNMAGYINENKFTKSNKPPLPNLQRARSMPELQIEIQEIKERIRQMKKFNTEKETQPIPPNIKSDDEKPSHNKIEGLKTSLERHNIERGSTQNNNFLSKTSQLQKSSSNDETHTKQIPKRTFYFGMKESNENTTGTNFLNRKHSLSDSSRSDSSCEIRASKDETKDGIALHLRPILPKKQLEIPRFSPSTAWKMLSTVENQTANTISGEENSFLVEEKIRKRPRYPPPPPPIVQIGSRSNNDKSGDSGISGDAGPPAYDDSQEIDSRNELMLPLMLSESQPTSWTPQQDLQEDSSEEETNSKILFQPISSANDKQAHRNVFSLSLPRDNRFATYVDNKDIHVNSSLQRFKNSVVGVLSTFNNKKEISNNNIQNKNSNWFLSKSVPNSLNNNGFRSLDFQNFKKDEDSKLTNSNHQQNIGRLMYLPEQKNHFRHSSREDKNDLIDYRRKSSNLNESKIISYISKSTENISHKINNKERSHSTDDSRLNKSKRFTFQSTIRQIERRRLAEKLSKEAEIKEKQRLTEFEAMQRVEREFQQKRAREKANIKQKLRLFSFEEANYFSLPYETNFTNDLSVRPEPDGALSSARSSPNANKNFSAKKYYEVPPDANEKLMKSESRSSVHESEDNVIKAQATEILSEYRQMTREYKDFRSSHYFNDINENNIIKPTTVYPQITYNMPKAFGYQHS